jgi:NADH dehydrogenase (ubiquinone) 1 alpha subcomplex subunit 5
MPQDAAYRKYTEQIVNDRLKAVQNSVSSYSPERNFTIPTSFQNKDVKGLEKAIGNGQAEELILQAEKELILARKMLGWKAWEPLIKQAPATQWQWPPAERKSIA